MESCPDKADKQEQEVGTLPDSQVNQVFYTELT